MTEQVPVSYTLSSLPPLTGVPVTLLVGLTDEPNGDLRVYLGSRGKGLYLLVPPEEQQPFRRAWATGGHVWMWPLPPAESIHQEVQP